MKTDRSGSAAAPTRSAPPTPLVATGPAEQRLELETVWTGDRYAQRVRWRRGRTELALLESVEGDEADAWPPSPPLQMLEVHQPGPAVWLAVGMAGNSHWSAEIRASRAGQPLLLWDVACRLQSPPNRLGHTFRWRKQADPAWLESVVDIEPVGPGSGRVLFQANCLKVRWTVPAGPFPQTFRWKLRLRFPRLP